MRKKQSQNSDLKKIWAELMIIKGTVRDTTIDKVRIEQSTKIKFLGLRFNKALNFNDHVTELVARIKGQVQRIRGFKHDLGREQLKLLYFSWVQTLIMTNAAVYLPEITQKQVSTIQIAANHAIRACANVRIKDKVNMSRLRKELRNQAPRS